MNHDYIMKPSTTIIIIALVVVLIAVALYRGYFGVGSYYYNNIDNGTTDDDGADANIVGVGADVNASSANSAGNVSRTSVSSVYVIDGDTIKAWIDGKQYTVRLIGINAPEKGQYYHDEAADKLKELSLGKKIFLESDAGVPDEDIYGRLLRYVVVGNTTANLELLRGGYTRYYPLNQTLIYAAEFEEAEAYAKSQNIGLWPKANTSCIGITIFEYNPKTDNKSSEASEEYVTFKNS